MAVPKRKTSTARRDKRRTHWKMEGSARYGYLRSLRFREAPAPRVPGLRLLQWCRSDQHEGCRSLINGSTVVRRCPWLKLLLMHSVAISPQT